MNPYAELRKSIESAVNRMGIDNETTTPDFIISGMLIAHLEAYRETMRKRRDWSAESCIECRREYKPALDGPAPDTRT